MRCFSKWIDTFVSEKGIDLETTLTAEGPSGPNYMPLACLLDALKAASPSDQRAVRNAIVAIDFRNGNVLPLFNRLAGAIAL